MEMPHEHLFEEAIRHEPVKSLAECLALEEDLHLIAVRYYTEEDEDREYSREELAAILQERIPARFETDFTWLTEEGCKLIELASKSVLNSAGIQEEEDTCGYYELTSNGFLYLFTHDDKLWMVFPEELKTINERLNGVEGLVAERNRNQDMRMYARALANLYGAYEIGQFAAVWNQHRKDKITVQEAEQFLEDVEGRGSNFWFDGYYVVHDSILGDDELDELLEETDDAPYYMPTKRILSDYARDFYYEDPSPELTAMLDFLHRVIPDGDPRREDLDFEIVLSCEHNWKNREIANLLAFHSFPLDDEEALQRFSRLYKALWNSTRQWTLRGDTPARYYREYGMQKPEFELPAPQEAKQVKVGRNEPCPCGSGKKYKKCCGR